MVVPVAMAMAMPMTMINAMTIAMAGLKIREANSGRRQSDESGGNHDGGIKKGM